MHLIQSAAVVALTATASAYVWDKYAEERGYAWDDEEHHPTKTADAAHHGVHHMGAREAEAEQTWPTHHEGNFDWDEFVSKHPEFHTHAHPTHGAMHAREADEEVDRDWDYANAKRPDWAGSVHARDAEAETEDEDEWDHENDRPMWVTEQLSTRDVEPEAEADEEWDHENSRPMWVSEQLDAQDAQIHARDAEPSQRVNQNYDYANARRPTYVNVLKGLHHVRDAEPDEEIDREWDYANAKRPHFEVHPENKEHMVQMHAREAEADAMNIQSDMGWDYESNKPKQHRPKMHQGAPDHHHARSEPSGWADRAAEWKSFAADWAKWTSSQHPTQHPAESHPHPTAHSTAHPTAHPTFGGEGFWPESAALPKPSHIVRAVKDAWGSASEVVDNVKEHVGFPPGAAWHSESHSHTHQAAHTHAPWAERDVTDDTDPKLNLVEARDAFADAYQRKGKLEWHEYPHAGLDHARFEERDVEDAEAEAAFRDEVAEEFPSVRRRNAPYKVVGHKEAEPMASPAHHVPSRAYTAEKTAEPTKKGWFGW